MTLPPPPPALADLRAGTRLVAGMGHSTVTADLDFETYSEAGFVWSSERNKWECLPRASQGKKGIHVVGAARYAEHPTAEVLSLAYDLKDGRGRRHWKPGDPPPLDLFLHIRDGGLIEAHNSGFETWIWDLVCVPRMGWPPIPHGQWRCSMAKARAHALPGALDKLGAVLAIATQKDKRGTHLLNKFSIPRSPTLKDARLRIRPEEDPEGPDLYAYNVTDIVAESEASALIPDLDETELANWQMDREINRRGVAIDVPSVHACISIVEQVLARGKRELTVLTEGVVTAPSMVAALTGWLQLRGVPIYGLTEDDVTGALARGDLAPDARRALEIRQQCGAASVKKLFAMANSVCADGRLHDLYNYHGARTGRPTGGGVQPTNLPQGGPDVALCLACNRHFGRSKQACPWCGSDLLRKSPVEWNPAVVEEVLAVAAHASLDLLEVYFDDALACIGGCLRGLFVAEEGKELISADYTAIEAVVLAMLSGEQWRIDVFRTHGKIYEAAAAKATGIPLRDILDYPKTHDGKHHPLRRVFKVQELALGYGGWVGAMIAFGAGAVMTEDEMATNAGNWRRLSPRIGEFWGGQTRRDGWRTWPELYGTEGAAIAAVQWPGTEYDAFNIKWVMRGDTLYARLLSGHYLTYHTPRLRASERRAGELTLSYEGWNTNPKNGAVGWVPMDTYGPKLVENVTQATARDIQMHGLRNLQRAGYPIVLHTYDEDTAEVPIGYGSDAAFLACMDDLPDWAAGWPVRAAGLWRAKRNRK